MRGEGGVEGAAKRGKRNGGVKKEAGNKKEDGGWSLRVGGVGRLGGVMGGEGSCRCKTRNVETGPIKRGDRQFPTR